MAAAEVVSDNVTNCAELYVPPRIEKVGIAAIGRIGSAQLDGATLSTGWNGVTAPARLNSAAAFCVGLLMMFSIAPSVFVGTDLPTVVRLNRLPQADRSPATPPVVLMQEAIMFPKVLISVRSEERRVGKEGRSRWSQPP